jgi:hypothetical protein
MMTWRLDCIEDGAANTDPLLLAPDVYHDTDENVVVACGARFCPQGCDESALREAASAAGAVPVPATQQRRQKQYQQRRRTGLCQCAR